MLTGPQQDIIKEVCLIELDNIDGLRDLLNSDELDEDGFKELVQFDGTDSFFNQLDKLYSSFHGLYEDPEKLFKLDDHETMIFRHILFTWEDKFSDRPNALSNLWRKFFLMEKVKTQISMS